MKVFALVLLAVGCVSAKGSGPYLPSGWRPDGPAFFLPSELQKPLGIENPPKEAILQESEASGSDFLREYGPPKQEVTLEVSQELTKQELPAVVTEQSFIVEAKENEEVKVEVTTSGAVADVADDVTASDVTAEAVVSEDATEAVVKSEEVIAIDEEIVPVTEYLVEDKTEIAESDAFQGRSLPTEASVAEEESTEKNAEVTQQENENANSDIVAAVEEKIEELVQQEVKSEEEVKNIAEVIVSFEKEISQQVQSIEEAVTSEQVSGSLEQIPEGFLEYGPPGFKEYGPPKQDLLNAEPLQESSEAELVESNETRKRRFSPKFRSVRKVHNKH